MEGLYAQVADRIYERGAFQFGAFKLKKHEKDPNAPLSPFFVNLRTPYNPTRSGNLNEKDCILIASAIWNLIWDNNLDFQAIAGLPYAADPIIDAIERITPENRDFRIIKLSKISGPDGRRIIPCEGFSYRKDETVLLVDDLVTEADSKIEAIKAIEKSGSVVKDLVVLIDREQGGKEKLKAAGYDLYSCFTIRQLLQFYLEGGYISKEKHKECLGYLDNN